MKRARIVLCASAIFAAAACVVSAGRAPREKLIAADLKKLQGTWTVLEIQANANSQAPGVITQWIFQKDRLFVRVGAQTRFRGLVALDPLSKPKQMDLVVEGKPAALGIYQLKSPRLLVCSAPGDRPAAMSGDGNAVLTVLQRGKALPQHKGRSAIAGFHRGVRPNAPVSAQKPQAAVEKN